MQRLSILRAVVADGFDWAAFHCLFAKRFFLGCFRLFIDVGMAAVVIPFEIRRRRLPAQIAVNALVIDIKLPGNVLRVFVRYVSHDLPYFCGLER
jgi:hypothetical protein